ncbi:MAG TPA: DUF3052 domain-containing protein [Acidimicrobiales bacterium]|nr:DUF3052 domain-containing protein [Acidimicrobiales bacterium]
MPGTGAGYSGTPLPRKLGIRDGFRVALVGAPEGFGPELDPMPDGVRLVRRLARGPVEGADIDLAVLFVTSRRDLARRFSEVGGRLPPAGALWVAWPKRSSGVTTDLTEDVLREVCLPLGWVDTKVCAVTEVWSGLKFVLRKENRPAG